MKMWESGPLTASPFIQSNEDGHREILTSQLASGQWSSTPLPPPPPRPPVDHRIVRLGAYVE
jgi:hypothetical protein